MLVMPVEGRLIRDPFTRLPVPPEGQDVDASDLYWARALADGDLAPASSKAEPTPPLVRDLAPPAAPIPPAAPAAPSDKG